MGLTHINAQRVLNELESQAVEMAVKRGPLDIENEIQIAIGTKNGQPLVLIGREGGSHVEIPIPEEPRA